MVDDESTFVRVADRSTLAADGQMVVNPGRAIALFHHDGTVYAVDNRCPWGFFSHRGQSTRGY